MTVIDPMTGSCLSSLRASGDMSGKTALGISSLSSFPSHFAAASNNTQLVMGYGGNRTKKGDTYGMLMAIRHASSPPILHWKCRLPESDLTAGLLVSSCGHYIVSGGASGTCSVWSAIGGSHLLRSFKAHYRAVTCMTWSDCGRYLVTGGADGMVHYFSLMEIVDRNNRSARKQIAPLKTWSKHHFPVTCLATMAGGRVASGSDDGMIILMQLFSGHVLATVKVPHGVKSLAYFDRRLYAGSTEGTIYSLDLDAYAMQQTIKQGAMVSKSEREKQEKYLTDQERIVGKALGEDSGSARLYLSDWIGHDREVTSIAVIAERNTPLMISGDESGKIRIWDIESRTCIRTLQPWANNSGGVSANDGKTKEDKAAQARSDHPIKSILVIPQPMDTVAAGSNSLFGTASSSSQKGQSGLANAILPLQKFAQQEQGNSLNGTSSNKVAVPLLRPERSDESIEFWQARPIARKKRRLDSAMSSQTGPAPKATATNEELQKAQGTIELMRAELEKTKKEVTRWEAVNNKLVAKLASKKK